MERRDFLRGLGSAGAAAALTACARPFQLSRSGMLGTASTPVADRDPDGLWAEAAAYARWTPSPHNIQPWRLRIVAPDSAELYADLTRRLPNTDPRSAFTSMSLAMFVENLSIALAPRGFAIRAEYVGRPLDYSATKPELFATLTMERMPVSLDAVASRELLLQRQTSRLPYDGTRVDELALVELSRRASRAGLQFDWTHDPDTVNGVIALNRVALFTDLDDNAQRTELRQWIRTSDAEAARSKDGLWSHCLRFPGWLLKDFFDKHEQWGRGRRADVCGRLLLRGMRGTRTVAWWSGAFEQPVDWIRAGRVFAHSWLALARQGIQLHPFGSIVTNVRAHKELLEQLGPRTPQQPIWMLVRIGRSSTPPRSYRLDAADMFLTDSELS